MAHTTFRPVDPAVLDADPFWSAVREQHPELDVILLPATEPEPDAAPAQPIEELRAAAADLIAAWRLLQPLVHEADAADPDRGPSVRWEHHDADVLILQRALKGIGQDAGTELLRTTVSVLGRAGWLLRPGTRRGLPLLDAISGRLHLDAVAGPGATVLTLSCDGLAAAAADQDTVRSEVLTQVAS